jgi:hypothetical protein
MPLRILQRPHEAHDPHRNAPKNPNPPMTTIPVTVARNSEAAVNAMTS